MSDLSNDLAFYLLLGIHCLIGSIGALVARNKGYNVFLWLIWGFLGGFFTVLLSLFLKDKKCI